MLVSRHSATARRKAMLRTQILERSVRIRVSTWSVCPCWAARRAILVAVLLSCLAASGGLFAQTGTERIATGFSRPVFATAPAGDTDRLFVAEQHSGRIEIIDLDTGNVLTDPFLELSGLAMGNEQGLLGFAFHPDYANNGYFFVNYTQSGGDTFIRRYRVDGDPATSNVADPDSGETILSIDQPQINHNGGWLEFGPLDGHLYIATGDGGGGNDDDGGHTSGIGNAQDTTNNLLGKILRIDPSLAAEPTVPYTVPGTNPFVGVTGDDEIWAYGLRNPFRSSFDRQTGDLWIGDVGQNAREEVDFQPAESAGGENYGWRPFEGNIATPLIDPSEQNGLMNLVFPVYDYPQPPSGQPAGNFEGNVIIGGYVYRGPVAAFQGHYIFADAGSQNIWKIDPDAVDIPASVTRINGSLTPDVGTIGSLSSFAEDAAGNLYLLELFGGGEIFRVTTASLQSVWNGDDATAGTAGDGTTWGSGNNWTRGSASDTAFVAQDDVVLAAGSSQQSIDLGQDRTVAALTFQAPYTLQNDTLQILSGNITVESGVTATIESNLAAESQHHALRKLGPGELRVEGQSGQIVVKEGTLGGSGTFDYLTVDAGGAFSPGASPGIATVSEDFGLREGGSLRIDIGGTGANPSDPEFDRLDIGGEAALQGDLIVKLVDLGSGTYLPGEGDQFTFLEATGGILGTFDDMLLPALAPLLEWELNIDGPTATLLVEQVLAGDFNRDDVVNLLDVVVWRDTLGQSVPLGEGADGDANGTINAMDYAIWREHYGEIDASAAGQATASHVPEPSSGLLLLLAGVSLASRIRFHRDNAKPIEKR